MTEWVKAGNATIEGRRIDPPPQSTVVCSGRVCRVQIVKATAFKAADFIPNRKRGYLCDNCAMTYAEIYPNTKGARKLYHQTALAIAKVQNAIPNTEVIEK